MPYVIQVTYSQADNSGKPIFEMDNFPEIIKKIKEIYRKNVIKPVFKENNGVFKRKTIGNNIVITQYIFETEEQARNFYAVLTDDTNLIKKKMNEMISRLPAHQFAKTERSVTFKGPNGEILI